MTRKFYNEKWAWVTIKDIFKTVVKEKETERVINERVAAVQALMQRVAIADAPFHTITEVAPVIIAANVPVPADDDMADL